MNIDEVNDAVCAARQTLYAADYAANAMADLLAGRLRHVSTYKLEKLKREIKDFNMHTGKWKS